MNVSTSPTTVTWFGVKGTRPMADIKASALRRTQASNRVVNMILLALPCPVTCQLACFPVNLDHLRRDSLPRVPARLLMSVGAYSRSKVRVPGEDDQCGSQLSPSLWANRQAVFTVLEDRHVARDLGRDHRQTRSHSFQQHDAEAFGAGGRSAKDIGAVVVPRFDGIRHVTG